MIYGKFIFHTSRSSAVGAETTCWRRNCTCAKCRVNAASDAFNRSCSSSKANLSLTPSLKLIIKENFFN